VVGAAALACVGSGGISHGQDTPAFVEPAPPPSSPARWREAPDYVALFVARPFRGAYRAFVSPLPIDEILHIVAPDRESLHAPGSWTAHEENPLDVFGEGGTYDRWKLARLFGSRRPRVARGPRAGQGLVEESWTLVSPYPAADLSRLEGGTLLVILRVP